MCRLSFTQPCWWFWRRPFSAARVVSLAGMRVATNIWGRPARRLPWAFPFRTECSTRRRAAAGPIHEGEKIMTPKRTDQAQPTGQHQTPAPGPADKPAGAPSKPGVDSSRPALPPAKGHPACDPHCVDVTGKTPEGIRVDPDITEGHPGYDESGDSEIIPPDRPAGQKTARGKGQAG